MKSSRSIASLAGGLFAILIAISTGGTAAGAQPRPSAVDVIRPPVGVEAVRRAAWQQAIARKLPPRRGCFQAIYPRTAWVEVGCTVAPNRPFPPKSGSQPQNVGNGTDYSAVVASGLISDAKGAFDSVTGVTSVVTNGTANDYSLQINSSFFSGSPGCAGGAGGCQGWQQFVYSNSGYMVMQYWLINYVNDCPAGWNTFAPHCWKNSASVAIPVQPIANLPQLVLIGHAGTGAGLDSATLISGVNAWSTTGPNNVVGLSAHWTVAEYNLVGDCCGFDATFNAGSAMRVRTSINNGAIPAPTCIVAGYTGETNSLNLVTAPAVVTPVQWPSIIFNQDNVSGGPPTCATSVGDTHLTTFGHTLYDFQSTGDFVLAQAGPDFMVQARQVSGAPTWPNASVNKGVAMQLGSNRIAIHIEPERLIVNGAPRTIAQGGSLALADGVSIAHLGNVYYVHRSNGDMVRAELNSSWINVTVSMAKARMAVARGLLVNQPGKPNALVARDGTVLAIPVSFDDLYRKYGDSWRVRREESLFREARGITPANPSRPFYAVDLPRADYDRGHAICVRAGVTGDALLDACTLDVAVLRDKSAAAAFLIAIEPRMTFRLRPYGTPDDQQTRPGKGTE